MDYTMIVIESLLCSLLLHLSFRVYILTKTLMKNVNTYKFGSVAWWHWSEHCIAAVLFFIGSVGMTWYHVMMIIDNIKEIELASGMGMTLDVFTIFMVTAGIVLINHMIKEETPGSELHHYKDE